MNVIIIIFMVISMIFALSSLGYVAVDVILEIKDNEKNKEEKKVEPIIVVAPPVVEEPKPEPVLEIVEQIDADEADAMISDSLAMKKANYESGAGHGKQDIINISALDANFEANDVITIALLKQKGLISKKAGRIKVLAYGMLTKPLTVKAENYSIQAIKMIELTGGTVIILKD